MKKILNIVSWGLFFVAAAAAATAVISTVAGVVLLAISLYSSFCIKAFAFCALSYFISLVIILVVYLIASAYIAIERRWFKK